MKQTSSRLDKLEKSADGGLSSFQRKIQAAEASGIPLNVETLPTAEIYELIGLQNPNDEELQELLALNDQQKLDDYIYAYWGKAYE